MAAIGLAGLVGVVGLLILRPSTGSDLIETVVFIALIVAVSVIALLPRRKFRHQLRRRLLQYDNMLVGLPSVSSYAAYDRWLARNDLSADTVHHWLTGTRASATTSNEPAGHTSNDADGR